MNLSDILCDFNCQHDWDGTLDDIADAVSVYNETIGTKEDPGKFIAEHLPKYWRIVREHNTYRWGNTSQLPSNSQYDVGIFLVGFSSLPIVLSIAEIQPRKEIYFLHSPETNHKCDEITNRLREMLVDPQDFAPLICQGDAGALIDRVEQAERRQIADPSDPVETFRQIKEIIDKVRSDPGANTKIALDLTGGKKTMIGGGFTAGSIYSVSPKCDMFYVDSSEYDPDRGAPKPGTEFLSQLDNPYDVYNVQTVQEAKTLFKRHNYEAAKRLWDGVRGKLGDHAERYDFLEDEREEARRYYWSSHCYHSWDALDYEAAVRRRTYKVNGKAHEWGYKTQHVNCAIDVLDILDAVKDKQTLFAEGQRVIHYAVDRYQNGRRRVESGKFEDAIVRFAQVIEILCNYQIYRLAQGNHLILIGGGQPATTYPNQIWDFKPLIRTLFGTGSVNLKGKDYYISSDRRLDVKDYGYNSVSEITNVIQPRNDFIHFNSSMEQKQTEEDARELEQLAHMFLEKFSRGYCENTLLCFDRLLKLHEFRR